MRKPFYFTYLAAASDENGSPLPAQLRMETVVKRTDGSDGVLNAVVSLDIGDEVGVRVTSVLTELFDIVGKYVDITPTEKGGFPGA